MKSFGYLFFITRNVWNLNKVDAIKLLFNKLLYKVTWWLLFLNLENFRVRKSIAKVVLMEFILHEISLSLLDVLSLYSLARRSEMHIVYVK